VTGGLYRFCRNPIYLGMLTMVTGLTALEPTALSLLLALTIYWCIRTQTLEEEVYLERTYGHEFVAYAGRVGRFVPKLGRL
jgi:protein-S-isoprenylcysteine O-methyltransferase Ste14